MAEAGFTWGQLKARIADDFRRRNLADVIQRTAIEAIEKYQPDIFIGNEAIQQWTSTVPNQITVPAPPQMAQIEQIQVLYAGAMYDLKKETINYIFTENAQVPPVIGPPIHYAIWHDQATPPNAVLYLWPVPDIVYPLTAIYRSIIPVPANDGISNFWTVQGEPMIRHETEGIIRASIVKAQDYGQADFRLAQLEKAKLKRIVSDLECTNRIKPVYF